MNSLSDTARGQVNCRFFLETARAESKLGVSCPSSPIVVVILVLAVSGLRSGFICFLLVSCFLFASLLFCSFSFASFDFFRLASFPFLSLILLCLLPINAMPMPMTAPSKLRNSCACAHAYAYTALSEFGVNAVISLLIV